MSAYSITIEGTSNPAIKKFQANQFLVNHNSYEFNNIDDAANSPLAQQLFYLPFVKTVYIAQNFVAIEKYNIVEWIDIQNEVSQQIEDYLNDNGVIIIELVNKVDPADIADYVPYQGQVEQKRGSRIAFNIDASVKDLANIEDERYKFF